MGETGQRQRGRQNRGDRIDRRDRTDRVDRRPTDDRPTAQADRQTKRPLCFLGTVVPYFCCASLFFHTSFLPSCPSSPFVIPFFFFIPPFIHSFVAARSLFFLSFISTSSLLGRPSLCSSAGSETVPRSSFAGHAFLYLSYSCPSFLPFFLSSILSSALDLLPQIPQRDHCSQLLTLDPLLLCSHPTDRRSIPFPRPLPPPSLHRQTHAEPVCIFNIFFQLHGSAQCAAPLSCSSYQTVCPSALPSPPLLLLPLYFQLIPHLFLSFSLPSSPFLSLPVSHSPLIARPAHQARYSCLTTDKLTFSSDDPPASRLLLPGNGILHRGHSPLFSSTDRTHTTANHGANRVPGASY